MPDGRWPANVIMSPGMAEALDTQSGNVGGHSVGKLKKTYSYTQTSQVPSDQPFDYGDSGGASRFFLTAGYEPWELEWIIANGLTPCGQ